MSEAQEFRTNLIEKATKAYYFDSAWGDEIEAVIDAILPAIVERVLIDASHDFANEHQYVTAMHPTTVQAWLRTRAAALIQELGEKK